MGGAELQLTLPKEGMMSYELEEQIKVVFVSITTEPQATIATNLEEIKEDN